MMPLHGLGQGSSDNAWILRAVGVVLGGIARHMIILACWVAFPI